jgi:ATP-dependent Clp protease ATP-binding subunit ClpB
MNFEQYTELRGFVQSAQSLALRSGHQRLTPEHLLKVLLESLASNLIRAAGGDPARALAGVERELGKQPKAEGYTGQVYVAPEMARLFDSAEEIAKKAGDSYVTAERLLLALVLAKGTPSADILATAGITPQSLNAAIEEIRKGRKATSETAEQAYDALKKYARDLTAAARERKLYPVIGRDAEIRQAIIVLSRRTRNNPVLIGEPGVGKTAIVEGLALRIVNGDVPEGLRDKRLFALDKGALRAGANTLVELEDRLSAVIAEAVASEGEVVLFEDEPQVLLGELTGLSALLKSALFSGEVRLIASATPSEYQKLIQTSETFDQILYPIEVGELSVDSAISTLRAIREEYELHHGVRIADSAIVAAVTLSDRYITDRFLPEKAIDLIDEAGGQLRLELDVQPQVIDEMRRRLSQLRSDRRSLRRETDTASVEHLRSLDAKIEELEKKSADMTAAWQAEKQQLAGAQKIKEKLEQARIELEQAQRKGDLAWAGELLYGIIPDLTRKLEQAEAAEQQHRPMLVEVVAKRQVAAILSRWTGGSIEDIEAGREITPVNTTKSSPKKHAAGPLSVYISEFVGEKYMGDRYENIHGSTLIVRSAVKDSCNKLTQQLDESYAKALLELAKVIANSKEPAAVAVFDEFSNELGKENKDHSKLTRYWNSIVNLVPDVAKIGEAAAKITSLFISSPAG